MTTLYPYGYGTSFKTLPQIKEIMDRHYHPEFTARFLAWLEQQGGQIGPGGLWRADGSQPDKPGFAPEGRSFHQNQQYSDGFIGACAVDLVRRNPTVGGIHVGVRWSDVPAQGSDEARVWGVHCNISSEAWHMQPIEIDGWQSWINRGSPAPVANYPFPGRNETESITVDKFTFSKARVLDTRKLGGKTSPNQTITVDAPAGALAVKVNLTAVGPTAIGHMTAFAGGSVPETSDLNYSDATVCNQVDVPVQNGQYKVFVKTPTHVLVDQVGFWHN